MKKQNSLLKNLLWILLFSLLFSACGDIAADENNVEKIVIDQPTSFLTETIVPTATITPTPEPAYALCLNIENFRDCYVPEEELLDGTYWHWLNDVVAPTLLADFKAREDQIRDDILIGTIGLPSGGAFFYDCYKEQGVYENEEITAPWNRNVTFAATSTLDPTTNNTLEYLVIPVFYYDKETNEIFPVVTVQPLYRPENLELGMEIYEDDMNMPVIVFSAISGGAFVKETTEMNADSCPLSTKVYEKLGQNEWWKRTERFSQGDYSAYSSPDMVVRASIISSKFFR